MSELRVCDVCQGALVGNEAGKTITFYRVRTETFLPNARAINQRLGMKQAFGFPLGLADVFSSEPEVADRVEGVDEELLLCLGCYVPIMLIIEAKSEREEATTAAEVEETQS